MVALLGLGMAFGGISMDEDTSMGSAGLFSGIWFAVSCLISVFAGSYYAARFSDTKVMTSGPAQGLIVASLFLGFFLYQTISTLGVAGRAAGNLIGSTASVVGKGARSAAQTPGLVENMSMMVEDRLGDLQLKSEPRAVAMGVAHRLVDGNPEAAKNYLAMQAGMTPAEADARLAQLKAEADKKIDAAKLAAADALRTTGWTLFILVALTSVSAFLGGMLGTKSILTPVQRTTTSIRTQTV
jgi:hypothetical protein